MPTVMQIVGQMENTYADNVINAVENLTGYYGDAVWWPESGTLVSLLVHDYNIVPTMSVAKILPNVTGVLGKLLYSNGGATDVTAFNVTAQTSDNLDGTTTVNLSGMDQAESTGQDMLLYVVVDTTGAAVSAQQLNDLIDSNFSDYSDIFPHY